MVSLSRKDLKMSNLLAERLTEIRTKRIRIRREAFKLLRTNRDLLKKDYWLMRKMDHNYLSDISDLALIGHLKKLEMIINEN